MDEQPPYPRPSPRPYPQEQPPAAPQSHPQYSRYDQYAYVQQYAPAQLWNQQPVAAVVPPAPSQPKQPGTGRSLIVGFGVALAAVAVLLGGVVLTTGSSRTVDGSGTLELQPANPSFPSQPSAPNQPGLTPAPTQPGGSSSAPAGRSGAAGATQQIGIVTIVSTLKYQNAQSAGTGMILTSDGAVLTNNHVIRGSTSIRVTVESTGRSYPATVVGTAPGSDVAMIKMKNASGLQPAKFADDARDVEIGDDIVGVGNGGGTGRLTAAAGKVTGLDESITASDETGQETERLTGLIEVNAKIISGDSGGPLYDAVGEIIGMNTAASASRTRNPTAYAIPVENAMGIIDRIKSGVETADIHIGYPGFLGVSTKDASGRGAAVAGLLDGGPAEDAGITTGSIITAVDGKRVTSADSLRGYLTNLDPGTRVTITWTDASGDTQRATMTLAVGPAD